MKLKSCESFAFIGLLLATTLTAPAVPVTFQVNLSVQKQLGAFDPATDSVIAAGTFDNWSPSAFILEPSQSNPNIYVGTYDDVTDAVGGTVQYKFIMSTASGTVWEAINNRTFTLASSAQTLPVFFFNNRTNAGAAIPITFQVNLQIQRELGNFDPATDTVIAAGTFNNWNASAFVLTNSPADKDVYKGTVTDSTDAPGNPVQYKFIINSAAQGVVWEGINNRTVTLASTNQTVPVAFFNNLTNSRSSIWVTFQVNLGVQAALGNFNPATDMVEARGSFNNWTGGFVLTNTLAAPNIFTGSFEDKTDAPGNNVEYKFVVNGGTWENGANRAFTLASTNQVLPIVFFNNIGNLGSMSLGALAGGKLTVNWTAASGIRLQSSTNLNSTAWQDVADSTGQGSMQFNVTAAPKMFFRLFGP